MLRRHARKVDMLQNVVQLLLGMHFMYILVGCALF
jgi:hypothetical protein